MTVTIIIIIIISFMELDHLLTRSGLTYPEVSSRVYHHSCCQLVSSVSLPWVIYFEAFCLHLLIKFNNKLSKAVEINKGIRQVCPLLPTLFNIYLDEIITKWQNQDITGIKLSKMQQLSTLLFADDQVIIADMEDNLQKAAHKLNQMQSHGPRYS